MHARPGRARPARGVRARGLARSLQQERRRASPPLPGILAVRQTRHRQEAAHGDYQVRPAETRAMNGPPMSQQARKPSRLERDRQMARQPGACLFCGRTGNLTKQHIFGKWLRNLNFKGRSMWKVSPGETQQRPLPPGSLFSKKLRIVCGDCNSGWMSRLENAAKPFLMDMFRPYLTDVFSGRRNIPLDEDAQLVLARWAFMTIAVVAQLRDSTDFPLVHCHELFNSQRPPENTQIWIGSASVNVSEGWEQIAEFERGEEIAEFRHEPKTIDARLGESTIPFPVYVTQLRLLNVVFDVQGSWPNEFGRALERVDASANLRRALLPIWPSQHPMIWWPPVESLDTIGGVRGFAATRLVGPAFAPP
jgi:hypothetical protein